MTEYKTFKVNALPAVPEPHSFYYVQDGTDPTLFNMYVIGATSAEVRHLPISSTVIANITVAVTSQLASVNADVMLNTVSGPITVSLPPVASGVQINFYYDDGNSEVVLEQHSADPNGIFVAQNAIVLDQKWDTVQVKAINNKWWIL